MRALHGSGFSLCALPSRVLASLPDLALWSGSENAPPAAAHERDPDELARELSHLLAADKTPEAIDATPAIPALTTDHDNTVPIMLPFKKLQ